ncbi:chemotaxis-specific methylesterase [compost metagenome]
MDVEKEQAPVLASLLNSEFSLVDIDTGAAEVDGAVLLLAGIGGPDAVRRVLAGLPEDFQRPVLVQLRLDGGRYANLVKQMARATVLPVALADPGQPLLAGNVYILPDAIGLELSGAGLSFSAEQNDLLSVMPPARSAVMMLSGADVALVPQVLEFAGKGGWVAGQIGEGCYDPAAASQLAVAEMTAGDPEYLVAELAVHCAG